MPPEDTTNLQPQASGASLIASGLTALFPTSIGRTCESPLSDNFRSTVPSPAARCCRRDAGRVGRRAVARRTHIPHVLLSTDEQRVLTYEQWSDDQPDVEDPAAIAYRLYRSGVRDDAPVPGCIVIVEVQTDRPATRLGRGSTPSLTRWRPRPRFIPAEFPATSTSAWMARACSTTRSGSTRPRTSRRVSSTGSIGRGPAWRRVQTMPGVENLGFRRYRAPWLPRGKQSAALRRIAQ